MSEPRQIGVYRDDAVWSRYARWFQVPLADLARLHVADYEVTGDASTHEVERAADEVRVLHPGSVLVY